MARRESVGGGRAPVPLRNAAGVLFSTLVLESPKTLKEFEQKIGQKWAREIVVDYYSRTEEGWLLGPMVKILSVMAKDNPTPGGLSRCELDLGTDFKLKLVFLSSFPFFQHVFMLSCD